MANWCFNELAISGVAAERAAFVARAGTDFEFGAFIPYPYEFGKLDDAAAEWDKANRVNGKLRDGVTWSERPKDGFSQGGREWCCRNWGTKWGAHGVTLTEQDNRTVYRFDTAWTPPLPVIRQMALEFPRLTFAMEYKENNEGFGGWIVVRGWSEAHAQFRQPFIVPMPSVEAIDHPEEWQWDVGNDEDTAETCVEKFSKAAQ